MKAVSFGTLALVGLLCGVWGYRDSKIVAKQAKAAPDLTVMVFVENQPGIWENKPTPREFALGGCKVLALWLEDGKPQRIEEWDVPKETMEPEL